MTDPTLTLADWTDALDAIAPPHLAQDWDNVGLLVGDPAARVDSALLCIDYTPAVAAETRERGCRLVVAYHPPIFTPIKRLLAGGPTGRTGAGGPTGTGGPTGAGGTGGLIFDCVRDGIAIYSPHTALDAAPGGTNDVLADLLGLTDRRPLRPSAPAAERARHATPLKLVTFVPPDAADRVAQALFAAGAGGIGRYTGCSFRAAGTGTFHGDASTHPAVGKPGRDERVDEVRLETIVPPERLAEAMRALRAAHPYEEPAFDIQPRLPVPGDFAGTGIGRRGRLPEPADQGVWIERLRRSFGPAGGSNPEGPLPHLLVAGPREGVARSAAVCAGAGGDLLDDAIAAGVDLYLTGELRHHDALRAAAAGMTVICTLHSRSERVTLPHLRERLRTAVPGAAVHLSKRDSDPFEIV